MTSSADPIGRLWRGAVLLCAGLWMSACGGGDAARSAGAPAPEAAATEASRVEAPAPGFGPFADWAAVVVAADDRAGSGGPTEAFDNARRDVAAALLGLGFAPGHVAQFSVNPERYPDQKVEGATYSRINARLGDLADRASGGCLVYVTSHGTQEEGVVLGAGSMSPDALGALVDRQCRRRPAIVVVSACHSGVFLESDLPRDNRMVLTAARADRSSFGCGEDDVYPYFDACLLGEWPRSDDWIDLAARTEACVARREAAEGVAPPSEPQIFVGEDIEPFLRAATF